MEQPDIDESEAYSFIEYQYPSSVLWRWLVRVDGELWTKQSMWIRKSVGERSFKSDDWRIIPVKIDVSGWSGMLDAAFNGKPVPEHLLELNPDYKRYSDLLDRHELEQAFSLEGNPAVLAEGSL